MGISKDSINSHNSFSQKYGLNFVLLSDQSGDTMKKYDAYVDKGGGKFGTIRKTFVIDANGKIAKIIENVKPEEHAKLILQFLRDKSVGK